MASAEGSEKVFKPRYGAEVAFGKLVPGKKYIIQRSDTGAWFRGTFEGDEYGMAKFSDTQMFAKPYAFLADQAAASEGTDVYPGKAKPQSFYEGNTVFYEYAGDGFTTSGGKRRGKKKTRKGTRKSRRTTRRKRFT